MKSTLIYKTVRGKETEALDKLVNDETANGFHLYGGPYGSGDGWMCQALVKESESLAKVGYQVEQDAN